MNSTLYSTRRVLALCALATSAVLLNACGSRTLDYRNAEIVNGKVYSKGANSPFSGKLTNVPLMVATSAQPGFNKILYKGIGQIFPTTPLGSMGVTSLCDVSVSDGLPDGKVTCKQRESDTVRAKFSFSDGRLDGSFTLFAPNGDDVFTEVDFKDGQPNGKQRFYTLDTHKLVHVIPWENGVMHGTEEGFDANTGKQTLESHNDTNGMIDGDVIMSSAAGTIIRKLQYSHGKRDGLEETFFPDTGKLESHMEWKDDRQDGAYRKYDGSGNVVEEARYAAGKRIDTPVGTTSPASLDAVAGKSTGMEDRNSWPAESNACTERWSAVFTKTHEKNTLVTYDQAWEWVDNCRAGKEPK